MLSGEISRSESLSRVSLEAEATFLHLVSVADDFGRFDGRPTVLLAALFPTRMETISLEVLGRWLRELEVEGLIRWYVVDGRRYLVIPTWGKYQRPPRAQKSKYPDPPAESSDQTASADIPLTNDSVPLTNAPVLSEGVGVGVGDKDSRPASPPALSSPPSRVNGKHARASPGKTLMPDAFDDPEWERLRRLVTRHDLSDDQLKYACRTVHAWSHSGHKLKHDWVLTVMNAIRAGWALRGY
jgi:hypothetical protein